MKIIKEIALGLLLIFGMLVLIPGIVQAEELKETKGKQEDTREEDKGQAKQPEKEEDKEGSKKGEETAKSEEKPKEAPHKKNEEVTKDVKEPAKGASKEESKDKEQEPKKKLETGNEKDKGSKQESGKDAQKNHEGEKKEEPKLFKKIRVVNQMPEYQVQLFINTDEKLEEAKGNGSEIELAKGKGEAEMDFEEGFEIKTIRVVVVDVLGGHNRVIESGNKPVTWTKEGKGEVKSVLKDPIQGNQINVLLEGDKVDKDLIFITLELVPMPNSTRDNMN